MNGQRRVIAPVRKAPPSPANERKCSWKEKIMRRLTILASVAVLAGASGFAHTKNVDRPCTTKAENNYLTVDAFLTR